MYTNTIKNYNLHSKNSYKKQQNSYTTINKIQNYNYSQQNSKQVSFTGERCRLFLEGFIYNKLFNRIKDKENGFGGRMTYCVQKGLGIMDSLINWLERKRLKLGSLVDYNKLKKEGFSAEQIEQFHFDDEMNLNSAFWFSNHVEKAKDYMFGYPANMGDDSAMVRFLRKKEAKLPLLNHCGDPQELGNYNLDAKLAYEEHILKRICEHLGINKEDGVWGYITSGGSESNRWGISNGLKKYPNATVYYSTAAHYSVPKAVKMNTPATNGTKTINYIDSQAIHTLDNSEEIDINELISKIKTNWETEKKPAVILLTWGTTKTGAIDNVAEISKRLNDLKIEHYIHLDAAMYGGIPKNQKNAPVIPNLDELGIDSISVSLHKYLGAQSVNSIVLAKTKPACDIIDYIGMTDTTTAGSRSFPPFSNYQRIIEKFYREAPDKYKKNIEFLENLLIKNNIKFERYNKANTFVIDKPSDEICKKYQLSTFKGNDGTQKAHIIIFPYHKQEIISELVEDLATNTCKTHHLGSNFLYYPTK